MVFRFLFVAAVICAVSTEANLEQGILFFITKTMQQLRLVCKSMSWVSKIFSLFSHYALYFIHILHRVYQKR